jgi:hypothetical protein
VIEVKNIFTTVFGILAALPQLLSASGIGHFGHLGGTTIDGAIGMLGTIGLGYFAADKLKTSQQAQ